MSEPPSAGADDFSGQLARRRRLAGMTQEELAAASGVSVRSISNIERGEVARPRRRTFELLAEVLAVDDADRTALVGPRRARRETDVAPAGPQPVLPRQLPRPGGGFSGRQAELKALNGWLSESLGGRLPAATVQISGTAGVGKTALAAHWGQHAAAQFPDGQLWVDLRGFGPAAALHPAEAIGTMLAALGVRPESAPEGLDAQVGLYRSLLAGKRMLIVLDSARDANQVRPLLPGSAGCLVVVTSRHQLLGLAVSAGSRLLELDVLSTAEARQLLSVRLGRERVAAERAAAGELIRLCARLPLAMAVTAAQAAVRPQAPLSALAAELASESGPLAALATADPVTDVQTVFSWSLQHLAPLPARLFRLLGGYPGPHLTVPAAIALLDAPPGQASAAVTALRSAALVSEHAPGRYVMHDLLRAYAAELARQESPPECAAAINRLLDHYLRTAAAAMDIAFPAERHRRPRLPQPVTPPPAFTGQAGALAWLTAELPVLVTMTGYAADHGWPGHATGLAATLFRYLDTTGRYPEGASIHSHARQAARATGDVAAEAAALVSLGLIDGHQSRYQQADQHLHAALVLSRQISDEDGQARALNYLGLTRYQQGDFEQAATHVEHAARLFRAAGELTGEAYALSNLAVFRQRQGHPEQAVAWLRQVLGQFRALADQHGEAATLQRLGRAVLEQGDYEESSRQFEQALTCYRSFGDVQGEAEALAWLSRSSMRQGQHRVAILSLRQILTRYRKLGDPSGQIETLTALGEACLTGGRPGAARAHYVAAIRLAAQTNQRYREAGAHDGLAAACEATGDLAGARRHHDRARVLHGSARTGGRSGAARRPGRPGLPGPPAGAPRA